MSLGEQRGARVPPQVAIVGVGAIGGVVAAELMAGGTPLILCVRRPFSAITIIRDGIEASFPAAPLTDPAVASPADWVLLATKVHQSDGAKEWLQALVGAHSRVAVLQNGVEHRERLSTLLPGARVVPVVVSCPAEPLAPGRVAQHGPMVLSVANDQDGRDFAGLFASTSIRVRCVDDFAAAAWTKLAGNAIGGALTALTGRPLEIFLDPGYRALARAVLREVIAVGRAAGVHLPGSLIDEVLAAQSAGGPQRGTSMLYDRRAHRPLEIDARNGVVVRLGKRFGIPTPYSEALVRLLEALQPGAGQSD